MAEFEFQNDYKSQGDIHRMIYHFKNIKLLCLSTGMELLIIDAKGVSLGVVIWPMEMQDLLDSVVSTAVGNA